MWDRKKHLNSLFTGLATALVLGAVTLIGIAVGSFSEDGSSAIAEAESLAVIEFLPQLEGPHDLVQRQVQIPVLLPTEIPGINNFWVTPRLEARTNYRFTIDLDRDCEGAGACTSGSFGGELITEESTTALEQRYADLDELPPDWPRSQEPKGPVELDQGIQGQFIPWIATAQCTEARVYWQENSYRYFVGLECGSQADLTEFANSVINNTERK